jgi:hypothetical protein
MRIPDLTSSQDRADVAIPHIEQLSHRIRWMIGITTPVWCMTLALTAAAVAGETASPKRHSLIHPPVAPASPAVSHPEALVSPSQPIMPATPPVTASPLPHHKLMKKSLAPLAGNPSAPETIVVPKTSSRLSSADYFSAAPPAAVTNDTSKNAPAPVSDRPFIPITPIATAPLPLSFLGSATQPTSSRSLTAATQSTAAASSRQAPASLSPSMARLIQLSPGLTALLQPSAPVVASPSASPPPSTPPSSLHSVSPTGSVTLSWSANAEGDLAGYKIYFGTSSGNYTSPGSPVVIGKTTTYTLTGLQRNTTYFFALSAYDSAGNESALSAEVSRSIL